MPFSDLVQSVASSKTLGYVFVLALLAGVYAMIPCWLELRAPGANKIPSQFHAALSLVLGWLLVFRTNTAYSRWWEARTLWGALVNASRNLALKFVSIGSILPAERQRAHELLAAFPVALKCHLRSENATLLPVNIRQMAEGDHHIPLSIVHQLYSILGRAKQQRQLDGDELRVLDAELLRLMDICGGCERILKTRIVRSYRVFARQCVLIFLGTLPWGVAKDFGLWALPLTFISAYFMLGLETVAEHVEEPFGYDEDDLDLESLCDTIKESVQQVFETNAAHQP